MTGYPAVRKTAHHAPALAELEFAIHTPRPNPSTMRNAASGRAAV
jgi:hypothetical protein